MTDDWVITLLMTLLAILVLMGIVTNVSQDAERRHHRDGRRLWPMIGRREPGAGVAQSPAHERLTPPPQTLPQTRGRSAPH